MTKKSLGYVELEWTCPYCNTRNPGRVKVCSNCGAAQPKDTQFNQAAEDKIITDQEELKLAQVGPDIHCPFCGTRNPGNATTCSNCGGDLTEGEKRETGKVLGAQQTAPAADVLCEYCGTPNPATNFKCSNCGSPLSKAGATVKAQPAAKKRSSTFMIIGILLVLLVCGGFGYMMMKGAQTKSTVAAVQDVSWKRSIVVLGLAPATHEAWRDEMPFDASVNSCSERERSRSSFPSANSEEVCGTPYVVDQGSGFGETVQDCEYIIYDDYCEYTVIELQPVGVVEETGSDLNPFWPQTRLDQGQELGEQTETYRITFIVNGESKVYETENFDEYQRFQLGSKWNLEINGFGKIVRVEPAP